MAGQYLIGSSFLAVLLFSGFLDAILPVLQLRAVVGEIFLHELEREGFEDAFSSSTKNYEPPPIPPPITFHAKLLDHPDLPRWLRYIQRTPFQTGYLYGSATSKDIGKQTVEVTAYERYSYETVRQTMIISIVPSPDGEMPYQADFLVKNWNVEEVLPTDIQDLFRQAVDSMWEQEGLTVVNITSALDRGGRVPLPIENRKEGVYIKMGSKDPFTDCLTAAKSPDNLYRCKLEQQPVITCYDSFSPQFTIDWCNLTLIDLTKINTTETMLVYGDGVLEDGSEFNPPEDASDRSFFDDFLLTLLLPFLLGLLLCLLLAYIMCCRWEGVHKRDMKTSDIQMVHHHTIHDNTEELREMAETRDVPRPLSTLPMFNVRTGEMINPLQGSRYDSAQVPLILAQQ
ncbi:alpha-sarcoglycan isoform X2 [Hemicordylus capensis]|uniref:alpha-sarcoglycan isoform X2 n=1 Tax=Hemicordylus capensis TaxID=884348 RepID=UPI0023025365|nr:alpha-sarcoglycan isoform X2 [Hemicordylus capensis]